MKITMRSILFTLAALAMPFSAAQAEDTEFKPSLKVGGIIFANWLPKGSEGIRGILGRSANGYAIEHTPNHNVIIRCSTAFR